MKISYIRLFAACLSTLIVMAAAGDAIADHKFLALGTSSKSGVYSPVGKGICDRVNTRRDEHLLRCQALNTGGSIYNIQALLSGELDLAITRADLAYLSFYGEGIFSGEPPQKELRAIATLYDNPIGVLVKVGSGIHDFRDLVGKRINIGNKGSGKRSFADQLFKIMRWSRADFAAVMELPSSKMAKAFCDGELDVLIQAMGIPADYYAYLVRHCGARFIAIPDAVIATFKERGPFFEDAIIPGGMYANNPDDVRTIGTKAVLISSARVDASSIGEVAKAIFEDIDAFRGLHPALQTGTVQTMLQQGVFLPFHDGALQYYQSKGLQTKVRP